MSLADEASWVDEFIDIQTAIMNITEEDIETTTWLIRDSYITKSDADLKSLVQNVLLAVARRPGQINILAKLFTNVQQLETDYSEKIATFTFKLLFPKFSVLTFERSRLAFIRELYETGFFTIDKIKSGFNRLHQGACAVLKDTSSTGYNDIYLYFFELAIYFGPILETKAPELWQEILTTLNMFEGKATRALRKLVSEFESVKADNWKLWKEHFDPNLKQQTIHHAIETDNVELFAILLGRSQTDLEQTLPETVLEPCDELKNGPTLAHVCACYGAVNCFKHLQLQGVNLKRTDDIGTSPAKFAMFGGSLEIVRIIQQLGVAMDDAIDYAIELHRMEMLQWLDEQQPNRTEKKVGNSLMVAVMHNNISALAYFKETGVDLGKFAIDLLKKAYNREYKEVIFFLLHEVVSNEIPFYAMDVNQCLRASVEEAGIDCIRVLIENFEYDPNTAPDGWPALHIAARNGRLDAVKYLTTVPYIDINYSSSSAGTALHQAAMKGREKVVKHLLSCPGIDVNAVDSRFRTPLHVAAECEELEIAKLLLAHPEFKALDILYLLLDDPSVDVNHQRDNGMTLLHMALHTENHELAMKLLRRDDVDQTIATVEGWTPLHYACDSQMEEEVAILIKNPEVDVNAVEGRNGCTPLHYATGRCAIPIVKLLFQRDDIDVNVVDMKLKTPWDRRPKRQHEEAFNKRIDELEEILRARGAHGNLKAFEQNRT